MSKERELLEALKESIKQDPYAPGAELAKESAQQSADPQAMSGASALDLNNLMDFFGTMGTSMVDDPMFYVKIAGLLVIAILILVVAFELIIGS
jgi:hypothetical protein